MHQIMISDCKPDQELPIKCNLLVCATGSVAAIKLGVLCDQLAQHFNIRLVITNSARKFVQIESGQFSLPQRYQDSLYCDEHEWQAWKKRSDPVLHIELRKWAHCMLIAPLSANSLAKISHGIADNLLTLICRAWDMKRNPQTNVLETPIFVAPAMNSCMWDHPITAEQLQTLHKWGYQQLGPIHKQLMCGQMGQGAMAEVSSIVEALTHWKHTTKWNNIDFVETKH